MNIVSFIYFHCSQLLIESYIITVHLLKDSKFYFQWVSGRFKLLLHLGISHYERGRDNWNWLIGHDQLFITPLLPTLMSSSTSQLIILLVIISSDHYEGSSNKPVRYLILVFYLLWPNLFITLLAAVIYWDFITKKWNCTDGKVGNSLLISITLS